MPSADLGSTRSLSDRAQQQFDALKAEIDAFLEDCDWGTEIVSDKDGWALLARIPQQPPEHWWIDLGQLAGNARAALDHLVFQLAIDSGSTPSEDRTQFPIFEVEADYLRGGKRSLREKMLTGVAPRHRKIIDDEQPYNWRERAHDHPLAMLRSLTDRHKHREQHVGAAMLGQFSVMMEHEPVHALGTELVGVGMTLGDLKNPNPVLDKQVLHAIQPTDQVVFDETGAPLDVAMTGLSIPEAAKFTIGFFGDRPFNLGDIAEITSYVRILIERFERRIAGKRPSSRPTR